jgi:hypothetical protein
MAPEGFKPETLRGTNSKDPNIHHRTNYYIFYIEKYE